MTPRTALGETLLPHGSLACRHCGVAVPRENAARIEPLTTDAYAPTEEAERAAWEKQQQEHRALLDRWASGPQQTGAPVPGRLRYVVELAVCEQCAEIEARASALTTEHPAVTAHVGGILRGLLAVALMRLDVLGRTVTVESNDDVYWLALDVGAGPLPRWSDRYSRRFSGPALAATERWSHVPGDQRVLVMAAERRWAAHLLAIRRAQAQRDRAIACPTRGCALCGVPSAATWSTFRAPAAALGGRGSERIDGHLCPPCQTAYEATGAVGPTLLERALTDALDPDHRIVSAGTEMEGITAWAVSDATPSEQPWDHVVPGGDLRAALFGPAEDERDLAARLLSKVSAEDLRAALAQR